MAFEKRRIAKDKCLTYTVNSVYDRHHPGGDPNSLCLPYRDSVANARYVSV